MSAPTFFNQSIREGTVRLLHRCSRLLGRVCLPDLYEKVRSLLPAACCHPAAEFCRWLRSASWTLKSHPERWEYSSSGSGSRSSWSGRSFQLVTQGRGGRWKTAENGSGEFFKWSLLLLYLLRVIKNQWNCFSLVYIPVAPFIQTCIQLSRKLIKLISLCIICIISPQEPAFSCKSPPF